MLADLPNDLHFLVLTTNISSHCLVLWEMRTQRDTFMEMADHLPNISSIVSLQSVSQNGNHVSQLPSSGDHLIKGAKNDGVNYKNNDIEHNINGFIKHGARAVTPLELTGSSVHLKLPAINLSKHYKVSNGNTEKQDHVLNLNRGRARSLARPLNCLSDVGEVLSHPNEQETAISYSENVSDDAIINNRHTGSPHNMLRNYSNVPTLPDIFHKVHQSNSSLVRASIKSNNTVGNNRDASRLSFRREASIASISKDLALVGRKSTLCHRTEANVLQRSRTYVYPVLLPISVHIDPGSFDRKQRKKK